jgi:hypothetical protein
MRRATSSVVSLRPRGRRRLMLATFQVVLAVVGGVVACQSHSRSASLGADRQVARPSGHQSAAPAQTVVPFARVPALLISGLVTCWFGGW